jgi:hypothetical protein
MNRRYGYAAMAAAALLAAMIPVSAHAATAPGGAPPEEVPAITVTPHAARPGQTVTVKLPDPANCAPGAPRTVTSPVLTIGTFTELPGGLITAAATVHPNAKPGTYRVLAPCPQKVPAPRDKLFTGSITVLNPTTSHHQVIQVPTGAPQTGGGAMAS